MTSLTPQQAAVLAEQAGFSGPGLVDIVAIMGRESTYDPTVPNPDSGALGLTQINWSTWPNIIPMMQSLGYPVYNDNDVQAYLKIPAVNLAVAYKASNDGTDFSDWNYPGEGDDSYLHHTDVPTAQAVVQQVTGQIYQPTADWTMGNSMATLAQAGAGSAPGTYSAPTFSGSYGRGIQMTDTSGGLLDTTINQLVNSSPPSGAAGTNNAAQQQFNTTYQNYIDLLTQRPSSTDDPGYVPWSAAVTAAAGALSGAVGALQAEGPSAQWNDYLAGLRQNISVISTQLQIGGQEQTAQSAAAQNYNTAQQNATARGQLALDATKAAQPYATANGKTSFTAADLGMQNAPMMKLMGIGPNTQIANYPGIVNYNPLVPVANAQAQMGITGPMPNIPTLASMGIYPSTANTGQVTGPSPTSAVTSPNTGSALPATSSAPSAAPIQSLPPGVFGQGVRVVTAPFTMPPPTTLPDPAALGQSILGAPPQYTASMAHP